MLLLLALFLGVALGQCDGTIADAIQADPGLRTLNQLLATASLTQVLQGPGPFTVFAPRNSAFVNAALEPLQANQLQDLLTYHVVPGAYPLDTLNATNTLGTVEGAELNVTRLYGATFVNDVSLVVNTVTACNGVIYVVDHVLFPFCNPNSLPSILETAVFPLGPRVGGLNTFVKFAGVSGLARVLNTEGPFTVFAPTDAAFANLQGRTGLSPDAIASVSYLLSP